MDGIESWESESILLERFVEFLERGVTIIFFSVKEDNLMILSRKKERERDIYIVKWEHRSGKSSVDESRRFFFLMESNQTAEEVSFKG